MIYWLSTGFFYHTEQLINIFHSKKHFLIHFFKVNIVIIGGTILFWFKIMFTNNLEYIKTIRRWELFMTITKFVCLNYIKDSI